MPIDLKNYLNTSWIYQNNLNGQIKTVILSAGLGKRMEPLTTHHIPKPMFPIGGKTPMSELWVRKSVESGITDISMNLCVLSDTIKEYFGDGQKFGADIIYVDEDTPSGTLGGVCKQVLGSKARKVMKNEYIPPINEFNGSSVFVVSGDIVSNFGSDQLYELYEIHKKNGAVFTMLLTPIPWDKRGEFGTVGLESPENLNGSFSRSGRIINFLEKDPNSPSNLNNASIYIIEVELLKYIDKYRTEAKVGIEKPFYDFGKHVFPFLLGKLDYIKTPKDYKLWGVEYNGLWFDVGRKRDYLSVNMAFLDDKIKIEPVYEKFPWGYLGNYTAIDFSKVKIVPPVVIGNDCIIEHEAIIGPYAVIGDDWRIEKGAEIRNSVLWPRYTFQTSDKRRISVHDRKIVDRHEVRKGAIIDQSIVAGGTIHENMISKTINVLEDGKLDITDIDWVPSANRV